MYGLQEYTIQHIQDIFRKYPEVQKAILYGSRAKGNFRPGSDIDITLMGDEVNLTLLHKIEDNIEELLLPYKIDLSIFRHIKNPDLSDHIRRIGKVFYSK